jgi:hypothetical protein
VLVFDATALSALIDSYRPVLTRWASANDGTEIIAIPALAIVEVAGTRGVGATAWDAILWPPLVRVLPLGESAAKEIGGWSGPLAARHALWEAQALGCAILTRDAGLYQAGAVPLLVV